MTTRPHDPTAASDHLRDEDRLDALVQTAFTVTAVLTRIGARHDLSLTQLRVLGILRDRTPRMAALADFLGLERSTMSGLINRAEQRGLVERGPDPEDARASVVRMTEDGQALAERVRTEVHDALRPLTGTFRSADCT